jgi:hypothetical protein
MMTTMLGRCAGGAWAKAGAPVTSPTANVDANNLDRNGRRLLSSPVVRMLFPRVE